MPMSPGPGASPLPPVAPLSLPAPLLCQTQRGWAWVCPAGTFTKVGAWGRDGLQGPERTWGHGKEALSGKGQDLKPSPDPSLGWGHPHLSLMPYGKAQP